MDVFEAIEKRHSYRGAFADEPVTRDDLRKIVQAGIRAPSGCNCQTTSFVIVDEPALLGELASIVDKPVMETAKAAIVCVVEHLDALPGKSFAVEDCAAAVENMLLAIESLGYATVWLDGVLRNDEIASRIAELLAVPDERQVRIVLPLGKAVERLPPKERRPFAERAWFNRWDAND